MKWVDDLEILGRQGDVVASSGLMNLPCMHPFLFPCCESVLLLIPIMLSLELRCWGDVDDLSTKKKVVDWLGDVDDFPGALEVDFHCIRPSSGGGIVPYCSGKVYHRGRRADRSRDERVSFSEPITG
jgi:hypothetical protein